MRKNLPGIKAARTCLYSNRSKQWLGPFGIINRPHFAISEEFSISILFHYILDGLMYVFNMIVWGPGVVNI